MAKKYHELERELAALRADYHERSETMTRAETDEANAKIKAANEALIAFVTKGAEPCKCGATPIGMKKRAGVFAIGCLECGAEARGEDRDEAVDNWNAK